MSGNGRSGSEKYCVDLRVIESTWTVGMYPAWLKTLHKVAGDQGVRSP